ncbi:DsbA family oxidoreductase [Pseudonocardia yunnanensis]|uniref:DsbA family oxidoreductase n=1 Tax=Pseudonocardia yunnanensis TaxID=58107 RepID=A0ABW4FDF1_9PSEU
MKVEIWSDVVCPWCAIGKRRFEKALAQFAHRDEVEVTWRSFELDPGAPQEREGDLAEHLASKYGVSREQADGMHRQMTETAAADGWEFHFEHARGGNTFDAHRLIHLGAERGVQDAVKERLFRAYLTEGERIGDPETLVRIGAEAGLDADEARAVLASDRFADEVRADERQAQAFGINGVPFFVIDRTYGVSGAQPAETLLEVLDTAWAKSHPRQVLTPAGGPDGSACTDGSCAV